MRARRALDKPAELILGRLSFAARLGGFDIIVFVVVPPPIGRIAVRTSRVAAFRGQIEHHVGRQRCGSSTIPRGRFVRSTASLTVPEKYSFLTLHLERSLV